MPVNQRVNGAVWNLLGSFEFAPGAGHKVVLSDAGNGVTIADAIRFLAEPGGGLVPRKVAADAVRFVSNDAEASHSVPSLPASVPLERQA